MNIKKTEEQKIRKEFALLKRTILSDKKKAIRLFRTRCKTLRSKLRQRWDCDDYDIFYEVDTRIDCLLHDLRNGG